MSTQRVAPSGVPLRGTFRVPGDKSISHRALFFATLRPGILLRNLAPGDDLIRTRRMIEAAGYVVDDVEGGVRVHAAPERPDALEHPVRIDCGNSGTTARLGLGWLTGERGLWKVTGDESLRRRPMGRIIDPLDRPALVALLALSQVANACGFVWERARQMVQPEGRTVP